MEPNESRQMEMLLEEGGLTDDGTTRDPVSGNEVPPGSMAEEVRDDVPAQLSEGEYVVPADVVRFYGVRFFEDLRGQAKEGLMDMEANGRIGGEPVAQTMDNQMSGELTPEELAALEQITGMAVGGMVPQPTQSTDPYLQQQQMYQQPAPVAMGNAGNTLYANEGVDVSAGSNVDPYTAQFTDQTAAAFGPGFLIDQTLGKLPTTSTEIRTVTMYGPNGEIETLTLPAQRARYDELLAMSYSETPVSTTTETTVGQTVEQGDGGGNMGVTIPSNEAVSIAQNEGLNLGGTIAGNIAEFGIGAVATAINASPIGLGIQAITGKTVSEHLGLTGDDDGSDTDGIFGGYKGLGDMLDGGGPGQSGEGGLFGGKTFAQTTLGQFLGFGDDSDTTPTPTTTTTPTVSARPPQRPDGDDRDTSWSGGQVAENQDAPDPGRSASEAQAAAASAAADLGMDGPATGGR